jgi:hypothetical protein
MGVYMSFMAPCGLSDQNMHLPLQTSICIWLVDISTSAVLEGTVVR